MHIKVNHSAVNQPDVNKINTNLEQMSKQTKTEKNETLEMEDQRDSRVRFRGLVAPQILFTHHQRPYSTARDHGS